MTKRSTLLIAIALLVGLSSLQAQNATPKNMTEVGLHGGHAFISGDLPYQPGYSGGLHVRKALDYIFSIRGDATYAFMQGERESDSTAFETTSIAGTLFGVISANSLRFNQSVRKVNLYGLVGVGASYTKADTRDGDNRLFQEGDYEVIPHAAFGAGVAFRVSKRINIGIEHQAFVGFGQSADLYDGLDVNSPGASSSLFRDVAQMTNLVVNFNIGNASTKSEPLYWINPLENVMNDIAGVKKSQEDALQDSDGDGVIDAIDQDPNTPPDVPVDTKGRVLDSDRDGVPDFKDREPYFPPRPGEKVDAEGVVVNPINPQGGGVSEDRVRELIAEELQNYQLRDDASGNSGGAVAEWFLPMIHFGIDKTNIKYSDYGTLASIARMMKGNPNLRLVVTGYADASAQEDYNNVISYRRAKSVIEHFVNNHGIGRGRFVLMWKGETELLVPNATSYMNRRVEFRVAQAGDIEMDPPVNADSQNSGDGY
jgi:outer membrane protein OmpA-like peptidoglycan-associated protein